MRCELQGRWQSGGGGNKGDGDGDKIKQIGHVQREHRLTINCELSKKQRASAANTGRGQGTCDTRNRTNRTRMQSKVWPSLSMICACLYDMKHIPHTRACNFMCAEDVDTDTEIRRYTFTGSCSCFTNNSNRGGGSESDGASLSPVLVTNTTSCHRAENRNANAAASVDGEEERELKLELKLASKLEQDLQKGSDNLYPRVCQKTFTIINRHVDYFFAHILPFLSRLFFVECR